MNTIIYAVAWAGIVMLYNFTMWEGNILDWWHDILRRKNKYIANPLGFCSVCFCFWFGIPFCYYTVGINHYVIFLGISELIIVLYTLLLASFK